MTTLSRNQRYLLNAYEASGLGRGLDYGCGNGHLVAAAVEAGHDFWGTEPYYGAEDFQEVSQANTPEAARDRIRLLGGDNTIPWEDATFDWVCSGQVVEHVHELDRAVEELARVTAPGGLGLHTFPVSESLVEQHNGVPLYHRVPARLRRPLAKAAYDSGVAMRFDHPDFESWFDATDRFYRESVVLRPHRVIERSFRRFFEVRNVSTDKLTYHLPFPVPDVAVARWLEMRRHGVALLTVRRADARA